MNSATKIGEQAKASSDALGTAQTLHPRPEAVTWTPPKLQLTHPRPYTLNIKLMCSANGALAGTARW